MKLILTILFFTLTKLSFAFIGPSTYYVANNGNDANGGGTPETAWKTIAKVNSYTFYPGSKILFNSGDTWNEQLMPPISNLSFGAYGTGAKPVITGFKTATGLTNVGNIWSASASSAATTLNVVKVNGVIAPKGRYPNTGYLQAIASLSATSVKITHDATNRVGSEIVIMTHPWILDIAKITAQNTGATYDTLTFTSVRTDPTGLPYFFQNKSTLLDVQNEWSFDSASKTISVYSTTQPTIEYSTTDTLINLHKKSNITIEGIAIDGANVHAVYLDSARNDTLRNVSFNNNTTAIYALYHNGTALINDSIQNNSTHGYFSFGDTSLYVAGNYFNNTGMVPGMGIFGYGSGSAGYNQGDNAIITNNQFINAGYNGFRWSGKNNLIYRNYVNGFCSVKNDGGGIYTWASSPGSNVNYGSIERENVILNGYGNIYGGNYSVGIYLDDNVEGILVDGNTVANVLFADIQTKGAHNNVINNTFYDSAATNVYTSTDYGTFKGNIFYNKSASNASIIHQAATTNAALDSNYYLGSYAVDYGGKKTLAQWQAAFPSLDVHSTATLPASVTSTTPLLYYNATSQAVNIGINGSYVDVKGNNYTNVVTLQPFKSALLFPAASISQGVKFRSKFRNLKL